MKWTKILIGAPRILPRLLRRKILLDQKDEYLIQIIPEKPLRFKIFRGRPRE